MLKESKNDDKGSIFSSLVSIYVHLYATMDKNKTTLVCGTANLILSDLVVCVASYHTQAALSCHMRPHNKTQYTTIS